MSATVRAARVLSDFVGLVVAMASTLMQSRAEFSKIDEYRDIIKDMG